MLRRPLAALAAALLLPPLAACSDDGGDSATEPGSDTTTESTPSGASCTYAEDGAPPEKEVEPPPSQATVSGEVPVTLTTSVGELDATLNAEATPCTVNSFVSLAEQGYFDATNCHRLTTEGIYVLQCGDPTGSGSGGPGYSFDDELTGEETYPAGTLAMANAGPDTNGSQFFIVYGDTQLDPYYTVFGTVSAEGIKVVEDVAKQGIESGAPDGPPKEPVEIESVTVG